MSRSQTHRKRVKHYHEPVIFGLAFATVLTLLVIPVCYSLAYDWTGRKSRATG